MNVPFAGQAVEIPYVCASVLLDGANIALFHLIQEVPSEEVRMGMRVARRSVITRRAVAVNGTVASSEPLRAKRFSGFAKRLLSPYLE